MNWLLGRENRLTMNSRVLLLGVLLLFPLFPFIWFGAAQLLGPRVTLIVVLSAECLISLGLLFFKVCLRMRSEEQDMADLVMLALRRNPI